jgi:4-hydroxy-2-oxoglutarate aldolase
MNKPLAGIFAALTTPFVGADPSAEKLRDNVRKYNRTGLAGYVVLGSTGEGVSLTDEESADIVEAVVESAGTDKTIIVGTARESTKATLDFTNRAAEAGIAAALVRPPCYYKSRMTREALKTHYLTLAEGSRVPVIVYNIPQNTGVSLEPGLVVELAAHPNIIGLKESSGSLGFLGEVVREVPADFRYFLGSGHIIYPGLEMGAAGAILAVACAAPEICVEIYDLFKAGKRDEARKLQLDLIPLNKGIMQDIGIAGVKHAQDLRGLYGGPPRLPLLPIDEQGRRKIGALLEQLGLGRV